MGHGEKHMELNDFFKKYNRVALGFSGGVDSSYLLWAALSCGAQIGVYYVSTAFQPEFERRDALRLARSLGVEPTILEPDLLACEEVISNPPDRCYYCKQRIFGAISRQASADGYTILMDGTNASDDVSDRPGMRALQELSVLSPLRMCGLTKEEIRRRSKDAGLFTWDKPAYACLATRTPAGERITSEILQRTEHAESGMYGLGFRDFRVRHRGETAVVEVTRLQMDLLSAERERVIRLLRNCGYADAVFSDQPRMLTVPDAVFSGQPRMSTVQVGECP